MEAVPEHHGHLGRPPSIGAETASKAGGIIEVIIIISYAIRTVFSLLWYLFYFYLFI